MAVTDAIARVEDQLAQLHERQLAILDTAEADNGGELTPEQRKSYDDLDAEYQQLKTRLENLEADRRRIDEAAERNRGQGRRTQPETLTIKAPEFLKDNKRGFETPREFLTTLAKSVRNGRVDDDRLRSLAAGSDEQSTVSDPYGGFLVPEGFMPNLLSVQAEGDPTAGRTTEVPMDTPTVSIPARVDKSHASSVSGGLQVYRRGETDSATSSRMEVEQVKLEAHSLFGITYATEELLERSAISFAAVLEAGFRDEFAARAIDEKLFGTGVGEMEGVVNAPGTVSQAKETGQAAATIVYENIIKMRSRCWGYASAIWLANHDAMPQLMLANQSVGTGGVPVWQPSMREDAPDLILGRPLFFTEFCETVGTLGDIVVGNWSQYLEGLLTGPNQAESMHVRFENHERTFKFWLENDGRSWWRSALTPKQSSTTLSPFVTLAARA